jgi:hypothetical protein
MVGTLRFAHPTIPQLLNYRAVPLNTAPQHLVHRFLPPAVGKNLDLAITGKTLRFDR